MFDVSWAELLFVTSVGLAFVGKRDLPKAAHTVGATVGRMVGLVQGARARADQFAAQSELQQLQNELRSGLRELDAVKAEMAVSMSPGRAMMGRELGRMTGNANIKPPQQPPALLPANSNQSMSTGIASQLASPMNPAVLSPNTDPSLTEPITPAVDDNFPRTVASSTIFQTQAAAAEIEWEQQGIAFQSTAERGEADAGSVQLAFMLQQSLLFDRYDQETSAQNAILQSKVEQIRQQVQEEETSAESSKK